MKRLFNNLVAQIRVINTGLFSAVIALILFGFIVVPTASAVELITNGDFEVPVVTHEKMWSTYYGQNGNGMCGLMGEDECNGGQLIPGWSALWSDTLMNFPDDPLKWIPGRIELQRDPPLVPGEQPGDYIGNCSACSGRQKAELDSHFRAFNPDNNVTIFQAPKTCPRTPYTLSYSWKGRLNILHNSDLDVLIDDVVVNKYRFFSTTWNMEDYNFISGDNNRTMLAFQSCGDGNTLGVFVDSVSLLGPDGSDPELCDDPENICESGKPKVLTLLYDGDVDGVDHHGQTSDEVIVETFVTPLPQYVHIEIFGHNKNKDALWSGKYEIGDLITINGPKNRIPPRLRFEIWSMNGLVPSELLQIVQFHTLCSQPLSVGDEFGAIAVWGAEW